MNRFIEQAKINLQFIYEKLKRSWLYFYIGDKGIHLYYYKNNVLMDSYYCEIENISKDDNFHAFITKYKKSDARFIINSKETEIKHDSFTVLDTFSKSNPVEKFCENNLSNSDIYSYFTHQIVRDQTDVWKAVICISPFTQIIERCFHLLRDNSINFAGIYIYQTMIIDAAKKIADKNHVDLDKYVYTTVSINRVSGISFSINNGKNILSSLNIEYPEGKSSEYIQGVIEQNLSDLWIKFKAYCEQGKYNKANILIVPTNIYQLMNKNDLGVDLNLFEINEEPDSDFSDLSIVSLAENHSLKNSTSRLLNNYFFYNQINSIIFKPIYLIIFITSMFLLMTIKDNYLLNNKITSQYNEYFKVNEEVRLQSANYPNVQNITQLADLYITGKDLESKKHIPFDFIEDFIRHTNNDHKINNVKWSLNLENNSTIYNISMDIEIDKSFKNEHINQVNKKLDILRGKYTDLDINLVRLSTKESKISNKGKIALKILARGNHDN